LPIPALSFEVHAAGKQYFNDHPDITGDQLFEGERDDSMITSINSGPMRRTDPSGRVGHWILGVHLIDQAREIGGFYEELLTVQLTSPPSHSRRAQND
jgi:hypothetical protein